MSPKSEFSESSHPWRWLTLMLCLLVSGFCFWQTNWWNVTEKPAQASLTASTPLTLPHDIRFFADGTPYRLKSVAEFQKDDKIFAFNHETGKHEVRTVVEPYARTSDHLRILEFQTVAGQTQVINTTNEHPFFSVDRKAYVESQDLREGEHFQGPTGEVHTLTATAYEPHPEGIPVFNVKVADLHNYFVAPLASRGRPVLAHNADKYPTKVPKRAGKTVLGSYPKYLDLADDLGARRFNIPTKIWKKMTPAQRLAANQKFLDRMITRGDEIILSNSGHAARRGTSFFDEIQYLKSKGFRLSEDGLRMLPPGT